MNRPRRNAAQNVQAILAAALSSDSSDNGSESEEEADFEPDEIIGNVEDDISESDDEEYDQPVNLIPIAGHLLSRNNEIR